MLHWNLGLYKQSGKVGNIRFLTPRCIVYSFSLMARNIVYELGILDCTDILIFDLFLLNVLILPTITTNSSFGMSSSVEYLHKGTFGITDIPIQLSISNPIHLCGDPANLAIQFVLLYEAIHLLQLRLFFLVLGLLPMVTSHHHKVN